MSTIKDKAGCSWSARLLLLCAVLFFGQASTAIAWDAGNPATKSPKYSNTLCVHSECNGGVTQPKMNFAGKVSSWFATSRVADCPAGYTNNGLTCGRGAKSFSAPSRLADCPSGYSNIGPAGCASAPSSYKNRSFAPKCPRGYTDVGVSCTKAGDGFLGLDIKTAAKTCPRGSLHRGVVCFAACKAGYTNLGLSCTKGPSTKGPSAFSCPNGYFQGVTKSRCHKNCPAGYRNMGETCFRGVDTKPLSSMTCKSNEVFESGRCISVPDIKLRGNTHLWVVNRALDLLSKSSDPVARKAVNTMRSNGCANKWRQGLYDGDAPTFVDDPQQLKRPTAGTHFYNPTGRDYLGRPTKATTYLLGGIDASSGGFSGRRNLNARQSADKQIKRIPAAGPNAQKGCYSLGVALHYLTDMTQPMHASSFSAVSSPKFLHPYFEAYVPVIQTRFPVRGSFKANRQTKSSPDTNFESIARRGNALAPALMRTLTANGAQCTVSGIDLGPLPYIGYCFLNDRKVDQQVGTILQSAYQSTAHYIYSVFNSFGNTAVNTNSGNSTGTNTGSNNSSPTGSSGSVTVYQHCNFGGYGVRLAPGRYNLRQLQARGIRNDDLSSIRVSGARVRVFQHDNFQGKSWAFTGNDSCFVNKGLNDVASSIEITLAGNNTNPRPSTNNANQEQNCFNQVQGKVAWSQAGNKKWGPANIKNLCAGTRNPPQTIACFQRGIAAHNDWARAIRDCAGKF